ncbi:hypothetical protein [Mesorhizobium captivum]|uniref:hypothetical protein n=1 Tax=Mesorhizobium captivum TaxID=3072319 RepID=UPI002A23CD13|nr:hypothetical protein [Mesorhizobium sp. VK3C]MDX8449112.1 hypothetical protein [Mesorhizobium sp. VK3C]
MPDNPHDSYPPELYEAIGRLIVACTRLDAEVTELIRFITYMSADDALITIHHQQFASKVDTVKALLSVRNPEDYGLPENLVRTIDGAKAVYDYRSTLVHAAWTIGEQGTSPETERITARGRLVVSRQYQPTTKIRDYAQQAVEIADLLESYRDRIG